MKKLIKILIPFVLLVLVGCQNQTKDDFTPGETKQELDLEIIEETNTRITAKQAKNDFTEEPDNSFIIERPDHDYLVNDSLYKWDEKRLDWVTTNSSEEILNQESTSNLRSIISKTNNTNAIVIDWKLLQNILYQLKYFHNFEMETFSPVFSEVLKKIDGKEIIIKGFVIPLDQEGEILALSANSFSSCFFCGNASPASVMSLYLKKKKSFKIDAFKKFSGILNLNYNDPDEFYYTLKEVVPIN